MPAIDNGMISRHLSFVRAQLRRFGVPPDDVEDLTQEVWLVCLARSPDLRDEASTFAWLREVSRRVSASYRRRRARAPLASNATEVPVRSEPVDDASSHRPFDDETGLAALAELDDALLDLLSLYGGGDLSMREVAGLLGIPETTAYSRYQSALAHVRRSLGRQRLLSAAHAAPAARAAQAPLPPHFTRCAEEELASDAGTLLIYRSDAEAAIGRLGNVVICEWRKRLAQRSLDDVGATIDLTYARLGVPAVLVNSAAPGFAMPSADERAALRAHIRRHGERAAIAIDVIDRPWTRVLAAMVNGAIVVTRAPTALVLVAAIETAERYAAHFVRSTRGALPWSQVTAACRQVQEQP
jgi:RNA polymerase sigma factor (sigma-70 family)